MTFTELLPAIRSAYVKPFAKAASDHDAHIEPAYRQSDGSLSEEGTLLLPCRADFIPKNENQPVMVDSKSLLGFDPISFDIKSTSIVISPFGWDWVTVQVLGINKGAVTQILKEWFLHWFDIEDNNQPTSEGLYGVLHFLSEPELLIDGLRVNIDLGSSPVTAFEDLLFRLSDANASEVHVGQPIIQAGHAKACPLIQTLATTTQGESFVKTVIGRWGHGA